MFVGTLKGVLAVTKTVNYGQLVCSVAGRDRGKLYLVHNIDKNILYLVDGRNRKVGNPKKKNIKHLQVFNYVADAISDKIRSGKKVADLEVREVIKTYMESTKNV